MTTTQTPPVPFGRHLGTAQRAGRALLDQVLAREGMTYDIWIALNLIASSGPEARLEDLERALARGLDISPAAVTQLLGQLARYGLVQMTPMAGDTVNGQITMTTEGKAEYKRLLEAVNQRSAQALSGIAPDALQTTIDVLQAFGKQAEALLAN